MTETDEQELIPPGAAYFHEMELVPPGMTGGGRPSSVSGLL